jgi:hypothetical protein
MKQHYLYAIVDRLPGRWRTPTAGLAGASVVPRRVEDLVVLGSLLDAVPPPSPRTLALHQDVVATVIDAGATLPFSYGTAVPASRLPDWLAGHRAEVTAALAAVRGCVEMSVKLLRLDCAVDRLGGSGPVGAASRELQALADSLVERAALPDWRYRPSGSAGNVAAAIAFLVPRHEVPAFLARIAPVASHATGVAVVPTGPWAPYSFVPELDRAPVGRVTTSSFQATGRRVG